MNASPALTAILYASIALPWIAAAFLAVRVEVLAAKLRDEEAKRYVAEGRVEEMKRQFERALNGWGTLSATCWEARTLLEDMDSEGHNIDRVLAKLDDALKRSKL